MTKKDIVPSVIVPLNRYEELVRDEKVLNWLEENVDTMFFNLKKDGFRLNIRKSTMENIERDAKAAKD